MHIHTHTHTNVQKYIHTDTYMPAITNDIKHALVKRGAQNIRKKSETDTQSSEILTYGKRHKTTLFCPLLRPTLDKGIFSGAILLPR